METINQEQVISSTDPSYQNKNIEAMNHKEVKNLVTCDHITTARKAYKLFVADKRTRGLCRPQLSILLTKALFVS